MIITEKFPQKSLYFTGAKLLQYMKANDIKFQLGDLYESFTKQSSLDFKRFMLTLDWLFLVGLIRTTDDGYIVKCS